MATATSALRFDLFVRDRTKGGVDSAGKRFGGLAKAGLALAGVGAVIGKSISKAADFDKTIRVAGNAAGASAEQMRDMSKMALEMGTATQFGAQGAAEAMVELSKSGLTIAEQKAGVLSETIKLASADSLSLGDAATYMTNAMAAFGLKAEEAYRVSTALAGGADASTASADSLAQGLGNVGAVAKQAGLTLEDTVGVLALFDQNAIKGAEGGTALKSMLMRLSAPVGKAAATIKKLNLQLRDQRGQLRPLGEIADEFKKKLSGLDKVQRDQAMQTIFGTYAIQGANIMIDKGSKALADYTKAAKDQTAVQRAVKAQTDGAAGNMRRFKSTVDSLQIAFALHLLPAVTAVVGGFADLTSKVVGKVDPAMRGIKGVVDKTVTPALKGLKKTATDALSGIDFSGVATDLAAESSKWAGSLMDGIRSGFEQGEWGPLGKAVGSGIGKALEESGDLAITFFAWIGEQIKKVDWVDLGVQMGKQAPLLITGLALGILNFDLGGLLSGLGDHWFEVILGVLTVAFLPARVIGAVTKLLAKIPFAGRILAWGVGAIHKGARGILKAAGRIAVSFFSGVASGLGRAFPALGALLEKGILALVHLLTRGAPKIGGAVAKWGRSMLGKLAGLPGRMAGKAGEIVGGLLGGLVKGAARLNKWLGGWPGRILRAVGNVANTLFQTGKDLAAGFVRGIVAGAKSVGGAVKEHLVNKPKNYIMGKLGFDTHSPSRWSRKQGFYVSQGLALGVKDGMPKAEDAVAKMVDRLKAKFDAVREFAKEIRDQFRALGDVTNVDTATPWGNEGGVGVLLDKMRTRVSDAERFAAVMESLRKSGLNRMTFDSLLAAGPEGGLKAAEQILGGGGGAIKELNALSAQLDRIGKQFGDTQARAKFGIDPNAKATATIKGQGAQTVRLVLDPSKSGDKMTRAVVEALREWVRVNGKGDVQVAFGVKR